MASIDVTVRGAGIFGLSIAWVLVQRGAKVRIIDPNGAASGASGGLVGALAPHVPENWNAKKAFQLDSLLMAQGFWSDVEQASGLSPGYARLGRLQPVADASAAKLARARIETSKALWPATLTWELISAPDGWSPLTPTGLVIRDTLSARLHPWQACMALVRALGRQGVTVDPDGEEAGSVIHATGWAGLAALSDALSCRIGTGVKGQAALLDFAAPELPQIYADGIHVVPHQDGTTAIGSTSERDFDDPINTDAQIDAVLAKARAAVPALSRAHVIVRWAGVRPRARTRAPMLGRWPGRPDHYIANGGFKIGFGMAPKVAETMANLVLEGHDAIPDGFRVTDNL